MQLTQLTPTCEMITEQFMLRGWYHGKCEIRISIT